MKSVNEKDATTKNLTAVPYYKTLRTFVQAPTVHANGHGFLKHDLTTSGFSLIFVHSSSFNATCSSFPELLMQSTERIEIPLPQL